MSGVVRLKDLAPYIAKAFYIFGLNPSKTQNPYMKPILYAVIFTLLISCKPEAPDEFNSVLVSNLLDNQRLVNAEIYYVRDTSSSLFRHHIPVAIREIMNRNFSFYEEISTKPGWHFSEETAVDFISYLQSTYEANAIIEPKFEHYLEEAQLENLSVYDFENPLDRQRVFLRLMIISDFVLKDLRGHITS
ncbi:MAG: hypothetical protein SchgKO_00030 [Schleiferiaceae bacterium]